MTGMAIARGSRPHDAPAWVAALVALAVMGGGAARAAETVIEAVPLPAPAFSFKGTTLCTRCHRSPQGDWCDEATTTAWRYDAHARSHLALSSENPRTRAIERTLGITATRTAACVACHTRPVEEPPVEEENEFVHAGISCETCHGPGSGYFEPHMEKAWRFLTSAEKESLGMRDLRNPLTKAANCLSCHLGEVASGRVISHEMYAAGHPPLPAFEMEAFSEGMGRHWKRVWEKAPRVQAAAVEAGYATEGASELTRTLVGAVATLRASVTLIESYAAAHAAGDARPWPELALYDCQAYHHDLAVPSWRQEAGYGGLVPGRPSFVRWPRALANVALAEAGVGGDVDALLAPYVVLLNRRPFGDQAGLDDLSHETLGSLDAAIAVIAGWPRDAALARREADVTRRLATAGARVGDFESARLLAWALAARRGDTTTDASARSGDLARLLALSFPPPHADPAVTTPFWITSLETAATADIAAVRAAFAAALHHAAAPGGEAEPIRPPPRGP